MPRKVVPPDPERQLMIKTKTCQRLLKEVAYYKKEVQENEAKLQQMKDDGRDPYDIKKFEEVLGESCMMVPDSERRLVQAFTDLSDFLLQQEQESENKLDTNSDWYQTAQSLLQEQGGTLVKQRTEKESDDSAIIETNVDHLAPDEAF